MQKNLQNRWSICLLNGLYHQLTVFEGLKNIIYADGLQFLD
jgi:hypothetical protein